MEDNYKYFYCGGVKEGFNGNDIDIYKRIDSDKNGYVGFYMFDDEYREYAFMDAYNKNIKEGSSDNGVGVIVMDSNLNNTDKVKGLGFIGEYNGKKRSR